jgi:hypothetical protein
MDTEINITKQLMYFSDSLSLEIKNGAYDVFCEVWRKISENDQRIILEHLEFILVKPINDPLYPNTAAFARVSPTQPFSASWIMWYPLLPLSLKKEFNVFCLAHELAHVYLEHPQRGERMIEEAKRKFKSEAEDETSKLISKWGIEVPTKSLE